MIKLRLILSELVDVAGQLVRRDYGRRTAVNALCQLRAWLDN